MTRPGRRGYTSKLQKKTCIYASFAGKHAKKGASLKNSGSAVGRSFWTCRNAQMLSQRELALRSGLSVQAVRNLERGRGRWSSVEAVLAALNVRISGRLPSAPTLGQRLLRLRNRRGMTQQEVAELSGLTMPTIRAIERGEPSRLESVEALASSLAASITLLRSGQSLPFYSPSTGTARSAQHTRWTTPPELIDALIAAGINFDIDPCSPGAGKSVVPASLHLTEEEDGLTAPWYRSAYVNPPYGKALPHWIRKMSLEAARGVQIVALLPVRAETRWLHDHVAKADVLFLRGALRFNSEQDTHHGRAPFASALVFWGHAEQTLARVCERFEGWFVPARRAA